MNSRKISVALCTYNGERFIEEQLQSILQQSMPVDEIIIGDDGSSDSTIEIAQRVLEKSGVSFEIRQHNPGLGVAGNFADAIRHTTGDLIFLCDQDDTWEKEKVEQLVAEMQGLLLVHTNALLVDGTGKSLGITLFDRLKIKPWEKKSLMHGDALGPLLRRNLVTGATVLMDGNFARSSLPIGQEWIHDEWLGIIAATKGGLRCIDHELIHYRQHANNVIGAKKTSFRRILVRITKESEKEQRRRYARMKSINEWVQTQSDIDERTQKRFQEALTHQEKRLHYPRSRVLRILPILREIRSGRYAKYSPGMRTVLYDLVRS